MAEWKRNQGEAEDEEIACESERLFQATQEIVLQESSAGQRRRSLLHIYTSL